MPKVGRNIQLNIFGASHSEEIGMELSNIKKDIKINLDDLQGFVNRRKAKATVYSTSRLEEDKIILQTGIDENGFTTGNPIRFVIKNNTQKSKDYEELKFKPRPSHADYVAYVKYGGNEDMRGGGKFSGRMTAPLCIAGGIAKQILAEKNIILGAFITEIGGIQDVFEDEITFETLESLNNKDIPIFNEKTKYEILSKIQAAKENGDSLGGVVEGIALNMPVGIGGSMFDGLESRIAEFIFGIPAVKGIEFGTGFNIAKMLGSKANDEIYTDKGVIKTYTNNNGGINGGISNGMPITFKVAFKPTPSIALTQKTVNLIDNTNTEISIKGRHDACIVPRAVVCVEASLALAILDCMMDE